MHRIYLRGSTYYVDVRAKGRRSRRSLGTGDAEIAERIAPAVVAAATRHTEINLRRLLREATSAAAAQGDAHPAGLLLSTDEIARRLHRAKARSKRRGAEFHLTAADLEGLIARANGRCELTGIPFSTAKRQDWDKAPFAPSLDRIDNSRPYALHNVRIVCHAVNVGINEWGESVFRQIAAALVNKTAEAQKEAHSDFYSWNQQLVRSSSPS